MARRRSKKLIKPSTIRHMLRFFGFSRKPIASILAVLMLGIGLGVAYEESVGIGTWHSFHPETDRFNVCFTPPSGCGSLIARQIKLAEKTIYVQAYGLTDESIIYQLKLAKARGVWVRVLLDGGGLSNNTETFMILEEAGIDVAYDKMPGIAHNKVIILDKRKVITGSYNFTNAANTRNAENVLLIDDVNIASIYLENWYRRNAHAVRSKK